eukprot:CAMPEP_0119500426 /NCGR_PEP_ID=MMETSP1344-20130328/22586_1 /TAXON_ID=236787 /ORGANISM="Florenciella parvula, Strain CCMP2471" /LENGTH=62 /DNA_ID=CAMNT_0007536521 /DNA_START=331 /DNA_END=519 /DNA_ORIENTATION=+
MPLTSEMFWHTPSSKQYVRRAPLDDAPTVKWRPSGHHANERGSEPNGSTIDAARLPVRIWNI